MFQLFLFIHCVFSVLAEDVAHLQSDDENGRHSRMSSKMKLARSPQPASASVESADSSVVVSSVPLSSHSTALTPSETFRVKLLFFGVFWAAYKLTTIAASAMYTVASTPARLFEESESYEQTIQQSWQQIRDQLDSNLIAHGKQDEENFNDMILSATTYVVDIGSISKKVEKSQRALPSDDQEKLLSSAAQPLRKRLLHMKEQYEKREISDLLIQNLKVFLASVIEGARVPSELDAHGDVKPGVDWVKVKRVTKVSLGGWKAGGGLREPTIRFELESGKKGMMRLWPVDHSRRNFVGRLGMNILSHFRDTHHKWYTGGTTMYPTFFISDQQSLEQEHQAPSPENIAAADDDDDEDDDE